MRGLGEGGFGIWVRLYIPCLLRTFQRAHVSVMLLTWQSWSPTYMLLFLCCI